MRQVDQVCCHLKQKLEDSRGETQDKRQKVLGGKRQVSMNKRSEQQLQMLKGAGAS